MPQLFKEGVTMEEATPHIGTVISGLQLTSLSPAALDEVALLGTRASFRRLAVADDNSTRSR